MIYNQKYLIKNVFKKLTPPRLSQQKYSFIILNQNQKPPMNFYYNLFIFYIFLIKILFVLFSSLKIYYEWKNKKVEKKTDNTQTQEYKKNVQIIENLDYWKKRFEFIYIMCMSILLIYLFYPFQKIKPMLTPETIYLIFLFAFVLITTANWGVFFKESPLFIEIQNVLGRGPTTTPTNISYLL